MNSFDIVVAYYENENYLNLLDVFSKKCEYATNTIIYNKSGKDIVLGNEVLQENKIQEYLCNNIKQIKAENIGKEGETYLSYIINYYYNLPEYTVFIQDDTENHITNYEKFVNFCNKFIKNEEKFKQYPCTWKLGHKVKHQRYIKDGQLDLPSFPSVDAIKLCCEEHNIYLPKLYSTETCAFFICSKDAILKNSRDFYIKLRTWLLNKYPKIDNAGCVLEHTWKLIFSDKSSL